MLFRSSDVFRRLGLADLSVEGIQGWLHQRIHGGGGLAEVFKRDGINVVLVHSDLYVKGIVV